MEREIFIIVTKNEPYIVTNFFFTSYKQALNHLKGNDYPERLEIKEALLTWSNGGNNEKR